MSCPSCGAPSHSDSAKCTECDPVPIDPTLFEPELENCRSGTYELNPVKELINETTDDQDVSPPSRLIEFPGASKSSMPSWRKELSERVREIQEKRAREAAEEAAEAERRKREEAARLPQLELLRQTQTAPLNPLVAAALRRIDRANASQPPPPANPPPPVRAMAAAAACAGESAARSQIRQGPEATGIKRAAPAMLRSERPPLQREPPTEKARGLVVVPTNSSLSEPEKSGRAATPRRLITEDLNDPALNYLDSVAGSKKVEEIVQRKAPVVLRFVSGVLDLFVIGFFFSPLAAVLELYGTNWSDLRILAIAAGTLVLLAFLYLTLCIAFTGRTWGMKMLSLRVVDERTGLIPTGKQSAGRALLLIASILAAGMGLVSALLDSERRLPHDRFTETIVVRA